jgi:hypothetical protein
MAIIRPNWAFCQRGRDIVLILQIFTSIRLPASILKTVMIVFLMLAKRGALLQQKGNTLLSLAPLGNPGLLHGYGGHIDDIGRIVARGTFPGVRCAIHDNAPRSRFYIDLQMALL